MRKKKSKRSRSLRVPKGVPDVRPYFITAASVRRSRARLAAIIAANRPPK